MPAVVCYKKATGNRCYASRSLFFTELMSLPKPKLKYKVFFCIYKNSYFICMSERGVYRGGCLLQNRYRVGCVVDPEGQTT